MRFDILYIHTVLANILKATVRLLFDEGRPLPNWRFGGLHVYEGEFVLIDWFDDNFKRHMRKAQLLDPCGYRNESPLPLLDAVVIWQKYNQMRVQGLIQDGLNNRHSIMTWHVEFYELGPLYSPRYAPQHA